MITREKKLYLCKNCSNQPAICIVPCFEMYHTKKVYRIKKLQMLKEKWKLLFYKRNLFFFNICHLFFNMPFFSKKKICFSTHCVFSQRINPYHKNIFLNINWLRSVTRVDLRMLKVTFIIKLTKVNLRIHWEFFCLLIIVFSKFNIF